jgi:hypothetical protein
MAAQHAVFGGKVVQPIASRAINQCCNDKRVDQEWLERAGSCVSVRLISKSLVVFLIESRPDPSKAQPQMQTPFYQS